MNTKKVKFEEKKQFYEILNYDRINQYYLEDFNNTYIKVQQIGSKNLLRRSLSRAEGKCSCFKCEYPIHNHENYLKIENNIIHCGNSLQSCCLLCEKVICEICKYLKNDNDIDNIYYDNHICDPIDNNEIIEYFQISYHYCFLF